MKVCAYCYTSDWAGSVCKNCGAKKSFVESPEERGGSLFFLNGYAVWVESAPMWDGEIYNFYLGTELIERLEIRRDVWAELSDGVMFEASFSRLDYIWELFLLARGEEQHIHHDIAIDRGNKQPKRFKLTLELKLDEHSYWQIDELRKIKEARYVR